MSKCEVAVTLAIFKMRSGYYAESFDFLLNLKGKAFIWPSLEHKFTQMESHSQIPKFYNRSLLNYKGVHFVNLSYLYRPEGNWSIQTSQLSK